MKKVGILNREISDVVASMGHGDMLCISDAGLAIPPESRRIELILKPGVPGLLETAEVVASELKVERIIVPEDTPKVCPRIFEGLLKLFPGVEVEKASVARYKELAYKSKAIIRTGEFTPYAQVILVSTITF